MDKPFFKVPLKHIQGKSSCLNVRSCIEVPILPQWVQDYVHEVKGRAQTWTCTLAWHTKESGETQKICTYKKIFKTANVGYILWRILDTHLLIRFMSFVWKNLTWNIQFLLFNLIVKEYTVLLLLQKGREFYELICWRQKLAGTDYSGMWTPFLSVASKHKHNSTMYFFLLELSSGKLHMESRMCFNYFSPLN